jgi:hypothetical protein
VARGESRFARKTECQAAIKGSIFPEGVAGYRLHHGLSHLKVASDFGLNHD